MQFAAYMPTAAGVLNSEPGIFSSIVYCTPPPIDNSGETTAPAQANTAPIAVLDHPVSVFFMFPRLIITGVVLICELKQDTTN